MTGRSVVIGTAGHIDHGKSALVLALTGTDPDRLKEEKRRGITIDLGFAHWRAHQVNFAFVDVPGHERFVKNMLAGVGGIDCVLLVVAADESVMPQTREHFEICRLLRVPSGIVVLTKVDLVDAEMVELVRIEVRELVAGSFLDGAPVLAVSARTGQGLPELREVLVASAVTMPRRSSSGATRLPIDRVFTMRGFGTVVTGTLVGGRIRREDDLVLLPSGRMAKVRGIQVHGAEQPEATAGQRVAVNLGGVEVADVSRGETLASGGTLEPTRMIDAVVEVIGGTRLLKHGARLRFHQGTSEVLGRVALAGADAEVIRPGSCGYVRLRLESPAVLTRGDRFVLRSYSPPITIGGGLVLDPRPPLRAGVRRPDGAARFAGLDPAADTWEAATERAARLVVAETGIEGLPVQALTSRIGVAPSARATMVGRLIEREAAVLAGETLVASAEFSRLRQQVLEVLAAHHRAEPLAEGLPREELRERLFSRAGPGVFERVLNDLVSGQSIIARERVALAGHRVALSGADEQVREAIERAFADAGLRPPDAPGLRESLNQPPEVIDRLVKLLLRQGVLVRIDTLIFHERALARLKAEVAALKSVSGAPPAELDVATFKDRFGVTRKFAIPLLEYLDRERVTKRAGDVRVIL